jgi:chitodextrinase
MDTSAVLNKELEMKKAIKNKNILKLKFLIFGVFLLSGSFFAKQALGAACTNLTSGVPFSTVGTCEWAVPYGNSSVTIEVKGAGGGGGGDGAYFDGLNGDPGARISGTMSVTAGEVLSITVAAGGTGGQGGDYGTAAAGVGGSGNPSGLNGSIGSISNWTGGSGGGGGRTTITSVSGGGRNGTVVLAASGGKGGDGGEGDYPARIGGAGGGPNVVVAGVTVNGTGNLGGGRSSLQAGSGANASVVITFSDNPPDTEAPSIPTDLSATASSATQIDLSWTASTDNQLVSGYKIFRDNIQIGTSANNTFSDSNLSASTAYVYTVSAYDANGNNSLQSASANVTTNPPSVPGAPIIGSATAGNGQATITFNAPDSDGGSSILSYTVTSSPGNVTVSGNGSPITITGLTNDVNYTFTVVATNAIGQSSSSGISNAVTPIGGYKVTVIFDSNGGTIQANGNSLVSGQKIEVPLNGNQTFTYSPIGAYTVIELHDNGLNKAIGGSYTISNINQDHLLEIEFDKPHLNSQKYTSSIKTLTNSGFGIMNWSGLFPAGTNIKIRVRTGTTIDGTGASWHTWGEACNVIAGQDISANLCVHDGDGYVQYQAILSTDTKDNIPSLASVTISTQATYSTAFSDSYLLSSPFNTGNSYNKLKRVTWAANGREDQVALQVRAASDATTLQSAQWCGPTSCSAAPGGVGSDFYVSNQDVSGQYAVEDLNNPQKNKVFQYAAFLKSADGTVATVPVLSEVTVQYSFNIPPIISVPTYQQNADGSINVSANISVTPDEGIPVTYPHQKAYVSLFYQNVSDIKLASELTPELTSVNINLPAGAAIPLNGKMLIDNELIEFTYSGSGTVLNIISRGADLDESNTYHTFIANHAANSQIFFKANKNSSNSSLDKEIADLTNVPLNFTLNWNPKNESNLNLLGKKSSGVNLKVVANDADAYNYLGTNSISNNVLDLEPPTLINLDSSVNSGRYRQGVNIPLLLAFSESVSVTNGSMLTNTEYTCAFTSNNSVNATCNHSVQADENTERLNAVLKTDSIIADQFGNVMEDFSIQNENVLESSKQIIIDNQRPNITLNSPIANVHINNGQISFVLNEEMQSSNLIMTAVTANNGESVGNQHTVSLAGGELVNLSQQTKTIPGLMDGNIYTLSASGLDIAGNELNENSNGNIVFDTTSPTVTIDSPSDNQVFNSVTDFSDIAFTTNEELKNGTYIRFTRTGGATDSGSPRTCNLSGLQLGSGAHDSLNLNDACAGFSLVDGVTYRLDMHAIDLAGNTTDVMAKNGLTYDITAPRLIRLDSNTADNTIETAYGKDAVINIRATYDEPVASNSNLTVTLDLIANVNVVLDQVSGNTISGTFTVDGPRLGYDTEDLNVREILNSSEEVFDIAGNKQTNSNIPVGQNLSDIKNIAIDTGTPILQSFTANVGIKNNGAYNAGKQITINAIYSKRLKVGSSIVIKLNTENGNEDSSTVTLDVLNNNILSGTYVVAEGDNAEQLKISSIVTQNAIDMKDNVLDTTGTIEQYDAYFDSLNQNIPHVTNIANFQIDTIIPALGNPAAAANFEKSSDALAGFALSASDNFSVSKIYYSLNGGLSWCTQDFTTNVNLDITSNACGGNTNNGEKTLTLKFADPATNESGNSQVTIGYDSQKPEIDSFMTSMSEGTYGPGTAIEISANYNEQLSSGSLILKLNNQAEVILSEISGNVVKGTYVIGSTGSNEDIDKLSVQAIVSQNISDTSNPANVQNGISIDGIIENLNTAKNITVDTSAPGGNMTIDRSVNDNQVSISANDGSVDMTGMLMKVKFLNNATDNCTYDGNWIDYADAKLSFQDDSNNIKKGCLILKDRVGNVSTDITSLTPETPSQVDFTDVSNTNVVPAVLGSFFTWQIPAIVGTNGLFGEAQLLYCNAQVDQDCNPQDIKAVPDVNENYVLLDKLTPERNYCYQMRFKDQAGNFSRLSEKVCAISGSGPVDDSLVGIVTDGVGAVTISNITKDLATVNFVTYDKAHGNKPLPTKAIVQAYVDPNLTELISTSKVEEQYGAAHVLSIGNLESGKRYYLKISATNISGSSTDVIAYQAGDDKLFFETAAQLSEIKNITETIITDKKAMISFATDQKAKCFIDFKDAKMSAYDEVSEIEGELSRNHSITLTNLFADTDYDYKITCTDELSTPIASQPSTFKTLSEIPLGGSENGDDETVPEISGVALVEISGESATITWTTQEKANSLIAYQIENGFMRVAGDYNALSDVANFTTNHSVTLNELVPATKYSFLAISYDLAGNIGKSEISTFSTKEPSSLSSVKVVSTALGAVTVTWRTATETNSIVDYGLTETYGKTKQDQAKVKEHEVSINGLVPGETYHFRVRGFDNEKNIFASSDIEFQPKSPPKISGFRIDSISEHEATVVFETNVSTDVLIAYTDTKKSENSGVQGRPGYVSKHQIVLKDLNPGTEYSINVKVRDENGNETEEHFSNFETTKDENPPKIDNVKTESALTQNDKVQSIIKWTTDEPAKSTLRYHESFDEKNEKEITVSETLTRTHIAVLTAFKPGGVYHIKVKAKDGSENDQTSQEYSILTPKRKENIIQIIIKNFSDIFGWTKAW